MEDQSPTVGYSWIRYALEKAGAEVINIFYDKDHHFDTALKRMRGPEASDNDIDDSSDFVCFFPALAAEIAFQAIETRQPKNTDGYDLGHRLGRLRDSNPYSGGRMPFVNQRLGRQQTGAIFIGKSNGVMAVMTSSASS